MPEPSLPSPAENRMVVDDLELDFVLRRASRHGELIELSDLSFELLASLARAAPAAVTFDELIEEAWDGAVVSDETVTQRVRLLRKALGDDGRRPRYIVSVRGRGYRLAAAPRPMTPPPRTAPGLVAAAVLLAVAALAWGALTWLGNAESRLPVSAQAPNAGQLTARAWDYFRRHQAEDNEIALGLFSDALAQDPDHVEALAGLSMAHAQRATKFNHPVAEAEAAESLARRALGLDPRSFEARLALATSLDARGRIPRAISAYERALELNPSHPGALSSVAYLYQVSGRLELALEYALRARARDPGLAYVDLQIGETLRLLGFGPAGEGFLERTDALRPDSVFAAATRARSLFAAGRYREAGEVVTQALARGVRRPELHEWRGVLALLDGRASDAEAAFQAALAFDPGAGIARTGEVVAARWAGRPSTDAYRARLEQLESAWLDGDRWPGTTFERVWLHAAFGDTRAAASAMARLVDAGFRDAALLLSWPGLEELRRESGYRAAVERMQQAVLAERERVLAAHWLPPDLLTPESPAAPVARNP